MLAQIEATRPHRRADRRRATRPNRRKPHIVQDEERATLMDWLRAGYGSMFVRNPALLVGLVPDPEFTASMIARQLAEWGQGVTSSPVPSSHRRAA